MLFMRCVARKGVIGGNKGKKFDMRLMNIHTAFAATNFAVPSFFVTSTIHRGDLN